MSLPYAARLLWDSRSGSATRNGRTVPLTAAPDLGGEDGPPHDVDYVPGRGGFCTIRRRACDPPDDMSPAERARADALLRVFVPSGQAPL